MITVAGRWNAYRGEAMTQRRLYAISVRISLLALLLVAGCPSQAAAPLPDLAGRTVKVAVMNDYPPFNFLNADTGEPQGWDYDVIGEMARRLNFTPQYVTTTFAQIIDGVAAGTYDMAGDSISITYDRTQKVDYSRQYMIVRQRLVIRKDETRVQTLVEFKANTALTVGAMAGTTNYATLTTYFPNHTVQVFDSLDQAIAALMAGQVDGVCADDVAYQAQQKLHPDGITRLPGVLYGDLLGMIFAKGSDLVDPVNQALNAMEKDGTLQAYTDKWIPELANPAE